MRSNPRRGAKLLAPGAIWAQAPGEASSRDWISAGWFIPPPFLSTSSCTLEVLVSGLPGWLESTIWLSRTECACEKASWIQRMMRPPGSVT